jgi:hypothetical protein
MAAASCADDDACLAALPVDCTASLDPTYDVLYDSVLSRSCGAGGGADSCHGQQGMRGGLGLFDADAAYAALLGKPNGRERVLPGDPKCSILMQRLESSDPNFRMPLRGDRLPAGVRCAIQTWIENGAQR